MVFKMIQVGLGRFGRRWLDVVLSSPDWRYAALVTRNAAVLQECGRKCSLGDEFLFSDLETALQKVADADAVLVTTPYFKHAEEALLSLRYGRNVLVEKPLCDTLADANRMRDAARDSGKILMVSENYRFRPAAVTVKDLVAGGAIGSPEFICIQYFVKHSFPSDDWRNKIGCPVLVENATHHYDLLRFITGKEPLRLSCVTFGSKGEKHWARPSVSVQIQMQDGLYADFCASWAYKAFRTPWEGAWWIRGTQGVLLWGSDGIILSSQGSERRVPLVDYPSRALKNVLDEFTDSLRSGRAPSVGIEDNIKTIEMVAASIESSRKGRPISIQELREWAGTR